MRPLDWVRSIKVKLGIVLAAAIAVTATAIAIGHPRGISMIWLAIIGIVLALIVVQLLARGMTSPLREMARASAAMSAGDYSQRVRATSRDEVGELARAFNSMAAELAEVDRFRRDLVANVSHELRTPISALQAVLENLVDGVQEPDQETLDTMLRQVERLGRLVTQLLDLSRLESGALPFEPRQFALAPVLEAVAAEARLRGDPVGIDVQVAPADLTVHGDPERVHQVVANLLSNALAHSPPSTTVEVRAQAHDGHVAIAVADEGPGIPPDEAARVFERFYRVDAARAASDGGAGLGLAITRWIVDLHGGSIRPEQRRPRGCTMIVELPAVAR